LLAGIANPDYFTWMVADLGCEIIDKFYYADHHQYREKDLKVVAERCLAQGVNLIITTEKDAVRLRRLKNIPQQIEIFVLRINFKVNSNEESITDRLHCMFNS